MDLTLLKAALPSIPVVNALPGVRKTGADPSTLHFERVASLDPERVRAYAEVCGFPLKDTAPLTYPHLLAFPLHMAVMTSPDFPYPAIGSVHLANSITSHRPVALGETLHVAVSATTPRPHPKGHVVDLVASATADGEVVWESTSTYLRRGLGDRDAAPGGGPVEIPVAGMEWRLPGDLGRRYAAVSGDHNPIHLYPLTAKALGFPRQIAHGMWSLARCVAAVENRLPDAVTVEVAFKKPILLPGSVGFGVSTHDDGLAFALTSPEDGAPHVVGRTSAASGA
ncbi:MAG: MaoC family dehydratase [Nocardioides sp.]